MEFIEMKEKATKIRSLYAKYEHRMHGKNWTIHDLALGLVGDIGDLAKLLLAHKGVRDVSNLEVRLKHELSDVLWSILVIANELGIDLEEGFSKEMNRLEAKIQRQISLLEKTTIPSNNKKRRTRR